MLNTKNFRTALFQTLCICGMIIFLGSNSFAGNVKPIQFEAFSSDIYNLELATLSKEEIPDWKIYGVGNIKKEISIIRQKEARGHPFATIKFKRKFNFEQNGKGEFHIQKNTNAEGEFLTFRIYHSLENKKQRFRITAKTPNKETKGYITVRDFKIIPRGRKNITTRWIKDPRALKKNKYALLILDAKTNKKTVTFECKDKKCRNGLWSGSCGSVNVSGKKLYFEGLNHFLYSSQDRKTRNSCYKLVPDVIEKSYKIEYHRLDCPQAKNTGPKSCLPS